MATNRPLPSALAGALVFGLSGSVLVLEILAARLLAPYVGLTLETYTAIIGVVLAGISAGTWAGGRLADRFDPRLVLGPLVILGGLLCVATLPIVRVLGDHAERAQWWQLLAVTLPSFFPAAAVLSASNPLVVKLQLRDLQETGRVVGRLSALGTAGAIAGTFVTGFVLLPSFRTSHVVVVLGLLVTAAGCALTARHLGRRGLALSALAALAVAAGGIAVDDKCEVETAYYCARVDGEDTPIRALWLDNLVHAIVDVSEPASLRAPYARRIADVIDVFRPRGRAIDALAMGGGGFMLPNYIAATRPGSTNLVLELDRGVVELAKDRLGLRLGERMRVRTGDARTALPDLARDRYDFVIGDAFAGLSVPWHLTTQEALQDLRRAMRPEAIYAVNLIDHGPLNFLRAEARTLTEVFRNVALIAGLSVIHGVSLSGNYILIASDADLPLDDLRAVTAGDEIVAGARLEQFTADAEVLTDDFAPADQLLTRGP